jgi:hypothetical protein
MKRNPLYFLLVLVGALSLAACSGPKGSGVGGGGGTGTVSFILVSDTLPANPSILSFKVSIIGVALTPTSGAAQTLTPSPAVVDLMRLQSDSAFLGTLTKVPAGTYTVTVSFSAPEVTFLNDTAGTITAGTTTCPKGAVCSASLTAIGAPQISGFTFTAAAGGTQGIGLDFNLKNSLTLAGGTLTANFNPAVLTAFTLPRANSNLASGQLDLVEDFTGTATVSGQTATIASLTRGSITATTSSTTAFDPDPSATLCPTGTASLSACVRSNQIASMDAILNANGTFSILEIEPLLSSAQDIVEGTVVSINPANQTQFTLVTTDKQQAATNSLIAALNTGDPLLVNLSTTVQPFEVDEKGLNVEQADPGTLNNFANATNTTAIHLGQTVAVHVTAFTAAAGTTSASAIVDKVILRWTRFSASVVTSSSSLITINTLPSYFNFTSASNFSVQAFVNAPRSTIVDGVTDLGSLSTTKPVEIRALFFENSSNSLTQAFFAAKVRQH